MPLIGCQVFSPISSAGDDPLFTPPPSDWLFTDAVVTAHMGPLQTEKVLWQWLP